MILTTVKSLQTRVSQCSALIKRTRRVTGTYYYYYYYYIPGTAVGLRLAAAVVDSRYEYE